MKASKYLKIGELKIVDGDVFVKQGYYDDGLAYGHIFKDEETYRLNRDAVCYIPEAHFQGLIPDEDGFYRNVRGYSHEDLLIICDNDEEMCDMLFNDLAWAPPEIYRLHNNYDT